MPLKAQKGAGKVPNKALHSRVSYLYQAASYLAAQQQQRHSGRVPNQTSGTKNVDAANPPTEGHRPALEGSLAPVSRRLISDLREVSLRAQIRLSPAIKGSICKKCDTLLIDGSTSTNQIENKSKGAKKPWADVLVQRCNTCGNEKRYPLCERQKRRTHRPAAHQAQAEENEPASKDSDSSTCT